MLVDDPDLSIRASADGDGVETDRDGAQRDRRATGQVEHFQAIIGRICDEQARTVGRHVERVNAEVFPVYERLPARGRSAMKRQGQPNRGAPIHLNPHTLRGIRGAHPHALGRADGAIEPNSYSITCSPAKMGVTALYSVEN